MASLVQDVWLGGDARLRGRRLAPYDDAPARLVFHPDLGMTLEEPALASFLEALGASVDVVAFEPRGQGGSSGRFGPEAIGDLVGLLKTAPTRWPDRKPLLVAGHGVGAALALGAAAETTVKGVVALAPSLPDVLAPLDLPSRIKGLRAPILALAPRNAGNRLLEALADHPLAAVLTLPGDAQAPLGSPWVEIVAAWARDRAAGP